MAAVCLLAAAGTVGLSWSRAAASPLEPPAAEVPEVIVSAPRPAPALWRVSSGEHVLWVLATVTVLPKHMQWPDEQIERILAGSQVLLGYPGINPDADIGVLSMARLLPTLIGVQELPEGGTLQQVLPAPVYARWLEARRTYLGDSRRFERLRPFIAADKLTGKAFESAGLVDDSVIEARMKQLAKKHHVRQVSSEYYLFIKDPKTLIRDFKHASFDESGCFSYELDELDHTLHSAAEQAKAWAAGDVATLESMLAQQAQDPCLGSVGSTPLGRDLGIEDIEKSINEAWLQAAETALAAHEQSFALLELADVLEPNGLLSMLQARGYAVRAP